MSVYNISDPGLDPILVMSDPNKVWCNISDTALDPTKLDPIITESAPSNIGSSPFGSNISDIGSSYCNIGSNDTGSDIPEAISYPMRLPTSLMSDPNDIVRFDIGDTLDPTRPDPISGTLDATRSDPIL